MLWIFLITIYGISCSSKSGNLPPISKGCKISGKVVSILDGDTFDILIQGNKTIRVRMEGIDAPERGMPFYRVSKKYLAELCFDKIITIRITGKDNFDRIIAYSYINDMELSHEMVKAGLAWHYKKYNSDPELSELEIEARNLRKGLWIDEVPMPPWENRRLHRNGVSTKDSFNLEDNNR
jgi:endonuclease YncB( thermonuclease family)